jgi:hypothetical protein
MPAMPQHLRFLLLIITLGAAAWIGWLIARPEGNASRSPAPSVTAATGSKPAAPPAHVPQGDPVDRFRGGKSKAEREEIMGAFMVLGHDRNASMLIEALKDESAELRIHAVEYAASLQPASSALVLLEACLNDRKDVREMGWSLLAPHPLENKAPVLMAAIERGPDAILEETFQEMGRTPERPLFEAMLMAAGRAQEARQARVLREMQAWLMPGGGNVPAFRSVTELTAWWTANRQRYDQYMLRVDL